MQFPTEVPVRFPHFESAVLKVTSRCNLNCTYCYMYNHEDNTHLNQPGVMSRSIALTVIERVVEHCAFHDIRGFYFVFHGGEPLLAKDEFFAWFVRTAEALNVHGVSFRFLLQTNGVLLSERRAQNLNGLGISIGISIDGPKSVHDSARVDHKGRGSYEAVLNGWAAAGSTGVRPGLLSVIDPSLNPVDAYKHICDLNPRRLDLLYPDATHDRPPAMRNIDNPTPHGDWLLALFHLWIDDKHRTFEIQVFVDILALLVTLDSNDGTPRRGYNDTIFIEPDGTLETLDLLRACENGIAQTRYNVIETTLDKAFDDPMVRLYYNSHKIICEQCAACGLLPICGGGNLAHRYRSENGFSNPSIYCADIKVLVAGITTWVTSKMSNAQQNVNNFTTPLEYTQ